MKPVIALFINHPECSRDCCDGIIKSLISKYEIRLFTKEQCTPETLVGVDIVAFPGGIGDAASYDKFFRRKAQNAIANFVAGGGKYLGVCMGAYWAGSYYFDILDGVDCTQYIKRPTADIRRPYGTVAQVIWNNEPTHMFFYDGCAFIGDNTKFTTIATYANGDAMAIIQNGIGLIGCHPESLEYWYKDTFPYIKDKWHKEQHHYLLLDFVDQLMQS